MRQRLLPVLLVALLLGASLVAMPQAEAAPPSLRWQAHAFHNRFHVLDAVSGWRGDERQEAYRTWWAKRFGLRAVDRQRLAAYADLRRRLAQEPAKPEPQLDGFVDLLPPGGLRAEERTTLAFLRAEDLAGAKRALGARLSPADASCLDQSFAHFRGPLDALWAESGYLEQARVRAEALAARSGMGAFLARLAGFYGVPAEGPEPNAVEFLLAPPGSFQATVVDGVMVIPFPPEEAADEAALAGVLGVVVHEFGHHQLSQVSEASRRRISNALLAETGILNPSRINHAEEAMQTAAGNILFLKNRLPQHFKPEGLAYSYERGTPYPYAIDALARRLAPSLAQALAGQDRFEQDFLPHLIAEQKALIPPAPRHFTRVAQVFTRRTPGLLFDGIFPSVSRWKSDFARPEAIASGLAQHPEQTAIFLVLPEDLAAYTRATGTQALPMLSPETGALLLRPRATGGQSISVLGADLVGFRKALIRLHQLESFPGPEPILCL